MLEPRGKGIVLWTLRYGDEVRDEDLYYGIIGDGKAGSDALPLIERFIKRQTREWKPDFVSDPVQKRLLNIIADKKKSLKKPTRDKPKAAKGEPSGGNVIDIMDALRNSLKKETRNLK